MKDKHTPGPWKVDGTYIYEVEQDKIIAEVETYNNNELPYEANARLMAAAPEMYNALRDLYNAWILQSIPFDTARQNAITLYEELTAKIKGDE